MDLTTLQQKIGEWAEATFPHHTDQSIGDHLQEEVAELRAALFEHRNGEPLGGERSRDVGEELADCLILLLTMAWRHNVYLLPIVAAKHSINQRRRWAPPDETGLSHHEGHAQGERS